MIKAYWIFITTGWKSIKYFGLPELDKDVLVCYPHLFEFKSTTVSLDTDGCFYDYLGNKIPEYIFIKYYRNLSSPPKQKDNA
jgi:hypothetical protein